MKLRLIRKRVRKNGRATGQYNWHLEKRIDGCWFEIYKGTRAECIKLRSELKGEVDK